MLTRHIVITSLDIGSTNTTSVITGVDGHGQVELMGQGLSSTLGYSGDNITDVRELGATISRCIGDAEEMAEMRSGALVASVGSEHVQLLQGRGGIPLHSGGESSRKSIINRQDIRQFIEKSQGTLFQGVPCLPEEHNQDMSRHLSSPFRILHSPHRGSDCVLPVSR